MTAAGSPARDADTVRPGLFFIAVRPADLSAYGAALGCADDAAALAALARAIAGSPGWEAYAPVSLAARPGPDPALGLFTRVGEAERGWLALQARLLGAACGSVRYVSYRRAEADCERLAAALVERLGRRTLERCRFRALPRGGGVVLGMLAYLLELRPEQLEGAAAPTEPLVLVDDCALTGGRLARALAEIEHPGVVFAHLYSHPELRAAVARRAPRVEACVAARDLEDVGPRLAGARYPRLRREHAARLGGERFWTGRTELIGFAWGEPDRLVWDETSGRLRRCWNLLPPELCLEHRPVAASSPVQVQIQGATGGALRAADGVLAADWAGRTVVGDRASGEAFALSREAAVMWKAILAAADLTGALRRITAELAAPEARLATELAAFAEDLVSRGLLVRSD